MTDILDILIIIGIILGIIVGIITIVQLKWKVLLPRFRLKRKLKSYKKIRLDREKEKKKANEIVDLLLKARKRLEYKGFSFSVKPTGHGDIIVKRLYKIHLTPQGGTQPLKFKISNVRNPDESYYSEGYPEAQKTDNNILALDNLIKII